mgnify:CR=1 FL=1
MYYIFWPGFHKNSWKLKQNIFPGNRVVIPKFDRGSRRLVLVSSNRALLEESYKLSAWINFKEEDVIWSPAKVSVYRPKNWKIGLVGDIQDHFDLVSSFYFHYTLSLSSEKTMLGFQILGRF